MPIYTYRLLWIVEPEILYSLVLRTGSLVLLLGTVLEESLRPLKQLEQLLICLVRSIDLMVRMFHRVFRLRRGKTIHWLFALFVLTTLCATVRSAALSPCCLAWYRSCIVVVLEERRSDQCAVFRACIHEYLACSYRLRPLYLTWLFLPFVLEFLDNLFFGEPDGEVYVLLVLCLVNQGVVFKLLPPVALFALHHVLAACLLDWLDVFCCFPVRAAFRRILVIIGVPPEILNVVGIYTPISFMIVCIGAPNCLVMIDKEGSCLGHQMDQRDRNLVCSVGERAEVLVFAVLNVVRVLITEFALISAGVVKLLDFIMRVGAQIFSLTTVWLLAHNVLIGVTGSPPIQFVMVIVQAGLNIVGVWVTERLQLIVQGWVLNVSKSNLKK